MKTLSPTIQLKTVAALLRRPHVDRINDNDSEYQREQRRLVGTVRCGGGRRVLRKKPQGGNY